MIHFEKNLDLKIVSKKAITNYELARSLFESIPDLENFKFIKNQEYDDNNYFDNIRVSEINGYTYLYGEYDEDEEVTSKLPKIPDEITYMIEHLVDYISEGLDFSEEERLVERGEYEDCVEDEKSADQIYFASYFSGSKLPNSFFIENETKWAVYYALDHGRFDEATEFEILAKEGNMRLALEYAKHVIKGRLPEKIENFYILNDYEDDKKCLKEYLEFVKNGKETQDNVAVLSEVRQG